MSEVKGSIMTEWRDLGVTPASRVNVLAMAHEGGMPTVVVARWSREKVCWLSPDGMTMYSPRYFKYWMPFPDLPATVLE